MLLSAFLLWVLKPTNNLGQCICECCNCFNGQKAFILSVSIMLETWRLSKCFGSTWIVLRKETCSSLDRWKLLRAFGMLSFERSTFSVVHRPSDLPSPQFHFINTHWKQQRQRCDWQLPTTSFSLNSLSSYSNVGHIGNKERDASVSIIQLTQKLSNIFSPIDQHQRIVEYIYTIRAHTQLALWRVWWGSFLAADLILLEGLVWD